MAKEVIDWRTLLPSNNMTELFSEQFDTLMDFLDRKIPFPYQPTNDNESQAMFYGRMNFALENDVITQEQYDLFEKEITVAIGIIQRYGSIPDELLDENCDDDSCPIHGKRNRRAKRLLDF